ncbi:hypothetical protein [Floridanema aerugineum]|uniref:Uncharacterized protein n=1 Tax=Floridaenema aerugineum BLCC-F46 TaxID=3153654 RepID=A0ABV4X401_9CYAN
MIATLQQAGVKHNQEDIVRIGKTSDGKIVFLEKGKSGLRGSGLVHILEKHEADFAKRGISQEQIPDVVLAAVIQGQFVRYQTRRRELPREIYKVMFNDRIHYVAVSVSDNGYIVGANPVSD